MHSSMYRYVRATAVDAHRTYREIPRSGECNAIINCRGASDLPERMLQRCSRLHGATMRLCTPETVRVMLDGSWIIERTSKGERGFLMLESSEKFVARGPAVELRNFEIKRSLKKKLVPSRFGCIGTNRPSVSFS